MNCPICDNNLNNNNFCESCNINAEIATKLINMSNALYNKGLEKANNSNLSGAIELLKKSIYFYKHNHLSRNVLGLIYFDIGKISEAYKEWMLSSMITKENNLATIYLDELTKNDVNMIKYKESIKMYNQGLTYLSQKSEDLAIIQLKKATDINSSFLDALNLLTLCYINQKNVTKSLETIERTLSVDITNQTSLKYKGSFEISKSPRKTTISTNKKTTSTTIKPANYSTVLSPANYSIFSVWGLRLLLALGVGVLLGFFVVYFVIVPPIVSKSSKTISDNNTKILEMENKVAKLEKEKNEMSSSFDNLKITLEKEKKELQEQVSLQDKIQNVNRASELSNEGNYEEAALLLSKLNQNELPDELIDKYNQLVERSYPRTANILYNRGLTKFRAKAYDEAVELFNNSLKYADGASQIAGDAKFYLGEIALNLEDTETATKYYTNVVDEHTNARNYWTAKNRLSRLGR